MSRFWFPTIGYLGAKKSYVVGGGTTGTQPTFSGDPLFTGTYVRLGDLVQFDVQVDMDNITNFGTGEYYVTLPFDAAKEFSVRGGSLYDADQNEEYHITGHCAEGDNTLYLYSSDKVSSGVQDADFTSVSPITLTTADHFHIAGSYIC